MGTPKQDYLAEELSRLTGITTVCVGAAFDFISGTKKEAPLFVQKIGMEWLFRLLTEPKRLWKRYIFGNLVFGYLCIKDWMSA
jgi:N-acetylglucosaminyldiphosphoundecaprenol N-acetyl-beta-D-mannosaminyltransferase